MKRWLSRVLIASVVGLGGVATVKADAVVVPNANATSPGNTDNRFPFLVSGGQRYQQLYGASQFPTGGPISITEIDLRNGIFVNQAFTATIPSIQISLSTTATAPDGLSTTFASNTGANLAQVYNGSLTLSSTNASGPGGTHVFDIAIVFQTPYIYNPASGNLLLDVKNNSGANSNVGSDFFDAVNLPGDSVSRVYGVEGNPNATTGTADSLGLITRFDFTAVNAVPEPSTLASCGVMGLAALAGAVLVRRRRKSA
jgi:MYXO-CTERM domain-containing protein